jgi:hypothetical protein
MDRDKDNIGLMHGFLAAVLVIVMVYAGEQVKTNPNDSASSWLMRAAAILSSVGIASLALSFGAATKSNTYSNDKDIANQIASGLYSEEGKELRKIKPPVVRKIEVSGQEFGRAASLQDHYHKINMRLTYFSLVTVVVSPLLFGIGVLLL